MDLKVDYVQIIALYSSDRLVEGLDYLKVAEAIRAHPNVLRPMFIHGQDKLKVEDILGLFKAVLSPPGSNARRSEGLTLTFWNDWLIEVGGLLFNTKKIMKLIF